MVLIITYSQVTHLVQLPDKLPPILPLAFSPHLLGFYKRKQESFITSE